MRWVKTAITIVIVLAILPAIVNVINDLTTGKEVYEGEYEIIITEDNINETIMELYELIEMDDDGNVTNYLLVEADGYEIDIGVFEYNDEFKKFNIMDTSSNFIVDFGLENPEFPFFLRDYLKITLYVNIPEPVLSPAEIILISLIPLIIVSGLLVYQYKELKIGKRL